MDDHQHLLNIAKCYLQQSVSPYAAIIDSDPDALKKAIIGLGELNLLALRVGSRWGGMDVSQDIFHTFQELVG
jgi:hypothetical protein